MIVFLGFRRELIVENRHHNDPDLGTHRVRESSCENKKHSSAGQLCPYFVCRVAGLPVQCVDGLRAPQTCELLNIVLSLEDRLQARKEDVSGLVYEAIGRSDDQAVRRRLLKLRRDLYNLRPWSDSDLAHLERFLPPEAWAGVTDFLQLMSERSATLAALKHTHQEELVQLRQHFRESLKDSDFQKGLLLSSPSLFSQLPRYLRARTNLNRKQEQIERGLLRYFTRMAMKATPFGTFCTIIPGQFTDETNSEHVCGPRYEFTSDPQHKKSFLRINKRLYGILLEHLKVRPAVRRCLGVELNPTIADEDDRLIFLSAVQGRETFQRIPRNPVLALIATVFARRPIVTFGDLILAIVADSAIEATEDDATAYLDKLIEIGFLRFRIGIPEQDVDWDLPFRSLLTPIDDEHARLAAALLVELRERMDAHASTTVTERRMLLDKTHETLRAAFDTMDISDGAIPDLPWYEDATSDARLSIGLSKGFAHTLEAFSEYADLIRRLSWPRSEQATMRHFFDSHYGPTIEAVPLLKFYEDFYREHFKQHLERQYEREAGTRRDTATEYDSWNPFAIEFVNRLRHAGSAIGQMIRRRWAAEPDAEEIAVTQQDLADCVNGIPSSGGCQSLAAFGSLLAGQARGRGPVLLIKDGNMMMGFGKFFSRFLYLLPDSVQDQVCSGNAALSENYLAEIRGDADFNANLHPPLLPWDLTYPTGETGEQAKQLSSSDIDVVRDSRDSHALSLVHRATGKLVIPVDLGFLNPRRRPPLFQLLCRFSAPGYCGITIPESPKTFQAIQRASSPVAKPHAGDDPGSSQAHADAGPEADVPAEGAARDPEIIYRPRITYRGKVILARKSWFVPASEFPTPRPGEDACDYFVRVNQWRRAYGMPNDVFVKIRPQKAMRSREARPGENAEAAEGDPGDTVAPDEPATENRREAAAENREVDTDVDTHEKTEADGAGQSPSPGAGQPPRSRPRLSRDFHKPQFIAFSNPLLVKLFGKLTVNLKSFSAILEERLPSADELPAYHDDRYATELIMQLDWPEQRICSTREAHPHTEQYVHVT